jgi:NTP pyrophosphatase (non-canonical NTP hydrolase)
MHLHEIQSECFNWATRCFGEQIVKDTRERGRRVVEEACELGQAAGLTKEDCHQLVDYVFSRPVGDAWQEVAGTLVTVLTLAGAMGIDAETAIDTELDRINLPDVFAKIRLKQVSKELHGIGTSVGIDQLP